MKSTRLAQKIGPSKIGWRAAIGTLGILIVVTLMLIEARQPRSTEASPSGRGTDANLSLSPKLLEVAPNSAKPIPRQTALSPAACSSPSFAPAVDYWTGPSSFALTVGNFNGDAYLDLAQTHVFSSSVSILMGVGNGTFQAPVNYAVGTEPLGVATGDFNGDNYADLAVANHGSANVSVLLNNGNGVFQATVNYPAGAYSFSIASDDFNGDNRDDLAVTNSGPNTVSILIANSNGTFQPAVDIPAGSFPDWITTSDFNGDSRADLAVANYNSGISILLGNGNGTFQTATVYPTGNNGASVTAGDLNGDNHPDLAVGKSPGYIFILIGNGDGTFQSALSNPVGSYVGPTSIGDFTGDNRADLAAINYYSNTHNMAILRGNGDGTFQSAVNYPIAAQPNHVAVGDFNNDNRLDAATANDVTFNGPGGGLSVLINNCISVTPTPTRTATPVPMLVGHIIWRGRPAQPSAGQIMPLTLTLKSALNEANYQPYLTTDASGFFTVNVSSLPSGTYQWRVKGPMYLATSGVVTLAGGTVQTEMGLQRTGDLNGDNVCDVQDFVPMKIDFGQGGAPPLSP